MNSNLDKVDNKPQKAIRLPQVCELTGASRATIWRWTKTDPTFPRRFHLSAGVTVWDEVDILAWLKAKKTDGA